MINYDIWGAPGSWDTVSAGADIKVPVLAMILLTKIP